MSKKLAQKTETIKIAEVDNINVGGILSGFYINKKLSIELFSKIKFNEQRN